MSSVRLVGSTASASSCARTMWLVDSCGLPVLRRSAGERLGAMHVRKFGPHVQRRRLFGHCRRVEAEQDETAPGEIASSEVGLTSSIGACRHPADRASHRRRLCGVPRTTDLTRPSSGRAKAGFASFVPPLKSNVRRRKDAGRTLRDRERQEQMRRSSWLLGSASAALFLLVLLYRAPKNPFNEISPLLVLLGLGLLAISFTCSLGALVLNVISLRRSQGPRSRARLLEPFAVGAVCLIVIATQFTAVAYRLVAGH